ncbi:MAG: site-2 protease family protein [Ruminococcaceae bacterium]|nr:site-2 protease family protein [Oscillospiraceae bacterium]
MLSNLTSTEDLMYLLLSIPSILIALTIHEVSHGYIAYKLGDPTAKMYGRLTLNPLKHLDPIGALCMLLAGFGWAKPVPINTRYFKNPRRDMALSALAGPMSNFILAFIGVILRAVLIRYLLPIFPATEFGYNLSFVSQIFILGFIFTNLGLGVFNLIPCPPLDGSRIFYTFLPPKYYFGVMKYERYISLGIMLLLILNVLDTPLNWITFHILSGMEWLVGLIPFL